MNLRILAGTGKRENLANTIQLNITQYIYAPHVPHTAHAGFVYIAADGNRDMFYDARDNAYNKESHMKHFIFNGIKLMG